MQTMNEALAARQLLLTESQFVSPRVFTSKTNVTNDSTHTSIDRSSCSELKEIHFSKRNRKLNRKIGYNCCSLNHKGEGKDFGQVHYSCANKTSNCQRYYSFVIIIILFSCYN